MRTLLAIFVGFWVIWILWYITGGPLRDDRTKPYVRLNDTGQIVPAGTTTVR